MDTPSLAPLHLPVLLLSLFLWAPCPLRAQNQAVEAGDAPLAELPAERLAGLLEEIATPEAMDPAKILLRGTEALALLEARPDPEQQLQVLSALSFANNRLFHYHDALVTGRRAEELARSLRKDRELASILEHLGKATRRLGEHRSSIVYFLEAIGLYEKLAELNGVATASTGIGHVYWRLGQYPKALSYFLRAQEAYAELRDQRGVGGTLRNIANLYLSIRQPKQALRLAREGLELQQELGNERAIGMLHSDLGDIYLALGEPAQALEYLLLAQESFAKRGFRAGEADVFRGMGDAYRDSGEVDYAMGFYESALRIRREIGDRKHQANTLTNIAEAEMSRGNHQVALDRLQEALTLATDTEAKGESLKAYQGLSRAYAGLGRYKEALEASDAGQTIERELFNENSRREFDDIFARFEADKAERAALKQRQAAVALASRTRGAILTSLAACLALMAFTVLRKTFAGRVSASREQALREPPGRLSELETLCRRQEARIAELLAVNEELTTRTAEIDDERPSLVFGDDTSESPNPRASAPESTEDHPRSTSGSGAQAHGGLVFPEGYLAGESTAIQAMYQAIRPLLGAELTVLIEGETGAGKEGVAHILHRSSKRADGPFVAVNCAAIPADLLEAEMFGIGKGVATGVSSRSGRFRAAEGGTLFLDEISEMPIELQAKLLRAVQERKIRPLGSEEVSVDAWVISASNQDLLGRVDEGLFRRDLYYRLAGSVLRVPPLRDRQSDLIPLFEHFLQQTVGGDKVIRGLTAKTLAILRSYPWPGNVRELEHEVKRLALLAESGQTLDSAMLSERFADFGNTAVGSKPRSDLARNGDRAHENKSLLLKDRVQELENQAILEALRTTDGNQSKASQLLGISRSTLARKISGLGIPT